MYHLSTQGIERIGSPRKKCDGGCISSLVHLPYESLRKGHGPRIFNCEGPR
jgi:hypothetical protein